MASVVITGDTSGAITLAAPATAGTNTITLPASTGTMALTASPTFTGTATIPTATVTTLNTPSGVLATQNGMTGIAKAWVNFNGSAATINSSFNVSSITRTGTGQYTVNYTTAMPNATYSIVGITNADSRTLSIGTLATTSSAMRSTNTGGAFDDVTMVSVAVFSS